MQSCPLDANAAAMIICDYGKSYINYTDVVGFQLYFERYMRIKIFTKEGYDWADHVIRLYRDGAEKEKVTKLKACTYNLVDGRIEKEKLKNSDVYTEEQSRHIELQKFSMPSVREGSVIELEYTVQSDFFFNLNTWYFQHEIPTVWSEYNTCIPEYFEYKRTMNGYIALAEKESTSEQKSIVTTSKERSNGLVAQTSYDSQSVKYTEYLDHWVARDVPAFIEEEPLTSRENYISKIEYELATIRPAYGTITNYTRSWDDINHLLLDDSDFGGQLNGGGFLKEAADAIEAAGTDDMGKIALAYDHIKRQLKWNGEHSLLVNENLKGAYDKGSGNSAEINLTLVLLLDRLGIASDPVAISTRSHGRISPAHPTLSTFNYVLAAAMVNDQVLLMDATDPKIPLGMLPERDLNGKGRIISKARSGWVPLTTERCDKSFWIYNLTLDDEQGFTGSVQASFDDYAAYRNRKAMESFGSDEDYIKAIQDNNPGLVVNTYEIINADNCAESLKQKFEVTIDDQSEGSADIIYFNPMLFEAVTENPFKLETRNYPVEFAYPTDKSCMVVINIPEGYQVDEMPQNAMVQLPENSGSFLFTTSLVGNTLQVMSKIQITKNTFLPADYPYLKEFYSHILNKHAEPVVLSRK